jgi:hypothetical protein
VIEVSKEENMSTPNQELLEVICGALVEAEVANEKEITSLRSRILAGKIKAEDWYIAVENSLSQVDLEPKNGS